VAISNRRLIKADELGVAFNKDYRIEGRGQWQSRRQHRKGPRAACHGGSGDGARA
jgi:hypothetical protein